MAEAHPVGFQWVMQAKARGATVIHIDPRFTRTSAQADLFVPLRAGSDIAFLGGVVNYILGNDKDYLPRFPFLAPAHQGLLQGHGGSNVPTVRDPGRP